jgi:peptide/nickel transport system substrate-binding protein
VNWNCAHWSDPLFDKQLDQLDVTADPTQRKAIVSQLGRTMMDATPVVITYHWAALVAITSKLEGPWIPSDRRDYRLNWLSA